VAVNSSVSERGAADGTAWFGHMRSGAWDEAWTVSDAVLRARAGARCWHRPRHEQWVWDGTPLARRRVLVRCYHGLGDTLQYVRFVPALRAVAREVTLWAQPVLLPLLATMHGIGPCVALHDGDPDVPYDVDVEVTELPHVARVTPATLPPRPRFDVTPTPLARDGRLAVGIVWECGDWDRATRAIPFSLLAPLDGIPGVTLHVLQRGPALADRTPSFGVVSGADDVLAAARVVRALDLVITVDSMPAHLAGALGVPVWTLLAHAADWRWMDGRDDTPWYPTMRLFRQPRPGDWPAVIARVAAELERAAAQHAPHATSHHRP
jgi:hypothetical protein